MYTKKPHTPKYATKKKYASCVCVSQYMIGISTVYRICKRYVEMCIQLLYCRFRIRINIKQQIIICIYMQWIHPNQTKCPNIQISNQTRDFKDPPPPQKKKNMKTHLGTWQSSLCFKTSDLWIWLWSKTPTPKDVTCFLPSKMPFQSPSPISFVGFCQYHTSACKHHSSPGHLLKCVWFFEGI